MVSPRIFRAKGRSRRIRPGPVERPAAVPASVAARRREGGGVDRLLDGLVEGGGERTAAELDDRPFRVEQPRRGDLLESELPRRRGLPLLAGAVDGEGRVEAREL